MTSKAEALPVSTGHPESWNLRPDSVEDGSTFEISENQNWMASAKTDTHHQESVNCPSASLSETNNAHSQTKLEDTCLREVPNQKQTSESDVDGVDTNAKKKRHASMSHPGNHKPMGRKRRKTTDRGATHPKFLMGGSITDPLNLNSLCNEEVSRCLNAVTPISSPLPMLNKDPNPVLVPIDVSDPLKLNTVCGEADDTTSLTRTLTPKSTGKKRKKRGDKLNESHSADEATIVKSKPANLNLEGIQRPPHHGSMSKVPDKIVSPVIPDNCQSYRKRKKQEPTTKIARALLVEKADSDPKEVSPDKKAPPHNRDRSTPEKRKYKRQTSKDAKPQPPKFKEQNKKFQYGNYHRYYGYRNPDQEDDSRIPFLKRKWFEGQTCLDIGCNSGHVTLYVAKNFAPDRITGIDIDGALIGIARKNIRHCLEMDKNPEQRKFPVSMEKTYGPVLSMGQPVKSAATTAKFPGNILFRCANFVPENDDILELQRPEYDTVLCLSVTKWIHLNWGDVGLKRLFRRIFLCLRPGGRLILESQAWPSYTKKKKLTETIYKNFKQIQLKPDKFKDYLLSSHVGFSSCETIGTPLNKSKGFRRPILMFTKLITSRASSAKPKTILKSDHGASSTHKMEEFAEPSKREAPSTGDPTHPAASQGMTCDPKPVSTEREQAAQDIEEKDLKVVISEEPETKEAAGESENKNEEVEVDAKCSLKAEKSHDDSENICLESPPAKKLKMEPPAD
ncbi:7SK snRNA methylphosphate capping enzyme-like [Patiria miniata]|uniref:RNA methyltransferase n=1 Tax=Patiria miniata TaxID=46514 RepID=A0A914BRF2_PATMI|nr:7SK snRNA methylphosphate capping enzyme-like [Patiria miniata]